MTFENVAAEAGVDARGLGLRRLRRRLRRRRPARSLRHQLRPEPALPQQGQRNLRRDAAAGRRCRLRVEHRVCLPRRRRRRRPRSLRRPLRDGARERGRGPGALPRVARRRQGDVRADGPARRAGPLLREHGQTAASRRPRRPSAWPTGPTPTVSASWPPTTTATAGPTSSSPTTPTPTSSTATAPGRDSRAWASRPAWP